jgi:microcystin-dependent protein
MPYQAGDNSGPLVQQISISVPALTWVQSTIWGVLQYLTHNYVWNGAEDFTSQQAADLFTAILDTWQVGVITVGQILSFTQDNMEFLDRNPANASTNLLPCDGRSLSTSDYPVLFGLIAYTFGGTGGSFNLPDLRGRTQIGVGQGPGLSNRALGDDPGEETHTLVGSEVPSHTHTVTGAAPNVTTIGPGAPEPTAIPTLAITSSAGGDGAHNNMQPSLALYYYIQVF